MSIAIVPSCLLALAMQVDVGSRVDAAQFARILGGLYAPIRDVELVCESEYRFVDESDPERGAKSIKFDRIVQCSYAYRSDGSAHLDSFEKLISDNTAMSHRTFALVGHRLETRILAGGQRAIPGQYNVENGGSGSIDNKVGSPGRFLFILHLGRLLVHDADLPGYQFVGWEQVDGHNCLKITIDEISGAPGSSLSTYWVDLRRGGHILKQDHYVNGDIWYRKHGIRLGQFPLPNGEVVWFPIHGEFDTFMNAKGPSSKPVFHEVVGLVRGSLVFNQGLSDDRFKVDWSGRKRSASGYGSMARDFGSIPAGQEPDRLKTDPASVQKYHDEKLAEANRQSSQLDASRPSGPPWGGAAIASTILAALGVSALVVAIAMRRRNQ
jgi:hypothetical protein